MRKRAIRRRPRFECVLTGYNISSPHRFKKLTEVNRRGIIVNRVPECLSLRRSWVPHHPPPLASVSSPSYTKGEKQHSLAGEGVGDPVWTTGKKAWHSVYYTKTSVDQNKNYLSNVHISRIPSLGILKEVGIMYITL